MSAIIKSQPADSPSTTTIESSAANPAAADHLALSGVVARAEQQLDAELHAWVARWEQMAVRLACQIASKCIRRELERSPQIASELVHEALLACCQAPTCEVRLHPHDFQHLSEPGQFESHNQTIKLVADHQVERGGCVVSTAEGAIDQTFAAQLRRIEQELIGSEADFEEAT